MVLATVGAETASSACALLPCRLICRTLSYWNITLTGSKVIKGMSSLATDFMSMRNFLLTFIFQCVATANTNE